MRLPPLRVDRPDAHFVFSDTKSAEIERGVAALQILKRQNLRSAALLAIFEKRGEPVRIIEKANLRRIEIRYEKSDRHAFSRSDRRLHVIRRDVRVLQSLRRLVSRFLRKSPFHDRRIGEIPGQNRLREIRRDGKSKNSRRSD